MLCFYFPVNDINVFIYIFTRRNRILNCYRYINVDIMDTKHILIKRIYLLQDSSPQKCLVACVCVCVQSLRWGFIFILGMLTHSVYKSLSVAIEMWLGVKP